ncbi:MAG: alkaline shock response membrane anchor protein AmaP [Pontiella sp.]|nr:alkaline shock response membrane anchor protein AmaP [Pontiella sp.]MBT8046439.1 alkaline shock response membrane anchor protein AmaP [Pontiella sp.]NNJ70127.1 alkaline shock response membrane anchor protein AmaP [Kiritimatiellales bacterium]
MKAKSGWFGNFVMTLLLLLIGAGLIYGSFFNPEVGQLIGDLLQIPFVAGSVGAILILSVLLRCAGSVGRKQEAYIDFQADDGSVGISIKAIQDFIERVAKEFAAVKSIDSKLMHRKGGLDIALSVRVVSGNKIPELSQVLQQRVRESVRESLGLEEIRNITIQVKEIVGEPPKIERDPSDGE